MRILVTGLLLTMLGILAGPTRAAGQTTFRVVTYLEQFSSPFGLIEGSPGVFYSSPDDPMGIFTVDVSGTKRVLAEFPPSLSASLVVSAANNRFYAAAYDYDTGQYNLFSVTSEPGSERSYPSPSLRPSFTENLPDGTLLGIGNNGTSYLVKTDLDGNTTPIYQFPAGENLPAFTAIYGGDGNYYGVSLVPQDGSGYVYRVTPSGSLTKLWSFPAGSFTYNDNWVPILRATDGDLYGATTAGGSNNAGTLYKVTLDGEYTLLHTFSKYPEATPGSLIEASDGNLYGTTSGGCCLPGVLFQATMSGQYNTLYTIEGKTGSCECLLRQGSDGTIYGTSQWGPSGYGVIFALDLGLPKPAPRAHEFHPMRGPVGTRVLIWGHHMLAASVQFNGVPASDVSNSGPDYVWATVPAGATTGPITVTTPNGTATTHASFTVN